MRAARLSITGRDNRSRGLDSYSRRAWGEAFAQLSAADIETPLQPEDLERLALSASLIAKDDESVEAFSRAHHEYIDRGDAESAARCAFWLGLTLVNRGEVARGSG